MEYAKRRKISDVTKEGHFDNKKKLLILDIDGLLADLLVNPDEADRGLGEEKGGKTNAFFITLHRHLVHLFSCRHLQMWSADCRPFAFEKTNTTSRPFCDEFLEFCFERFNVGVWTALTRFTMEYALDFLMRDNKHRLLFRWDQAHCTEMGFNDGNEDHILFVKELRKLWEKKDPGLPWEVGEYDESNTLLVENYPHKALDDPVSAFLLLFVLFFSGFFTDKVMTLVNFTFFFHFQPHTTIFPYPYRHYNTEDNSLGPGGDLRIYLKMLAASQNVQKFVSENPFDQHLVHVSENYPWISSEDYLKFFHKYTYKRKAGDSVDAQRKNSLEPKVNSSSPLATQTSLEQETSTATALVGQPLSEPDLSNTGLGAQTSTEPQTNAGTITDYQQDWPFIKHSPIWATIDSLVSCLTPPQKPHFFPLKKTKELHREGLAIAHMLTCYNLVQSLPNIKLNDPVDIINDNLEVLVDLEAHGFDVDLIRCRLNELLSLKSKAVQHEDTLKELEKRTYEKLVIEKEMDQLKAEMEKLQEKMMHAEIMRKAKEEELVRLQSNLHPDFTQINDWELAFGKLAATPL
ncbi:putative FCP1 domain, HAD-like superfamily protein [Helianthus anomalus]